MQVLKASPSGNATKTVIIETLLTALVTEPNNTALIT
ncbi:hypothetical protein ETSB_0795 [cyanobacterium endosymbiont of Epithemia turgida isolate EtSB Lake Yunoko]|nr:hypothetical protein ETSB_0795 [cyanobacterium endosymbiont of Epithemia turgida isolate EtSB Lake Yunoko]